MMASGSRNSHALRRSAPTNRFEPTQASRGKNTKNRKSENQTLPAWSSRSGWPPATVFASAIVPFHAQDRPSVESGKSVSVRVDLGCSRCEKKKKEKKKRKTA